MVYRHKGNVLEGFTGGENYDRLAFVSGFPFSLYRKAAAEVPMVEGGMHVLDLGCGTASFSLALAERLDKNSKIYGIDLAQKQISYAMQKTQKSEVPFEFRHCSMDNLPFENETFDAVISSMAFHEVPSSVRRRTIHETARVLKPEGTFTLVDISRPQLGVMAVAGWLWFASRGPDPALQDHWDNTFPMLCRHYHMQQITDTFLNATIRCQVFRKNTA